MFVIGTRESYYFGLKRIVKRIVKFNKTERNIAEKIHKLFSFESLINGFRDIPLASKNKENFLKKN